MNLLVDLGNTRLKWALDRGERWEPGGDIVHAHGVGDLLDQAWSTLEPPAKAVVASVAGTEALTAMQHWMTSHWSLQPRVLVASKELLGVRNHYSQPDSLGSDRWAALIAAHHIVKGPLVVVDGGTAVTLDALSAEGDYQGGVIFPGLNLLRQSLDTGTHGIKVEAGNPRNCLARTTADGIAAGTLFGLSGAIDRVVSEFKRTLGVDTQVILTGGDGRQLAALLSTPVKVMPDLVLKGLGLIAERLP